MRKKILLLSFITGLTLAYALQLSARHIIGGEMTYTCLGADTSSPGNHLYLFTIKMYRDCSCTDCGFFDSTPNQPVGHLTLYAGNDNSPLQDIILDPPVITNLDPSNDNPCIILPPGLCVQEGVYTFEISLPVIDSSYHLVYQRCCRNSTIINILEPDETGATFTMELTPDAQQLCNSSPVFSNFPPITICVNELLEYDASAIDAEGDQLIYELCAPLRGGSVFNTAPLPDDPPPFDPVSYLVPTYSADNPLGANPAMSLDPLTGQLSVTPAVPGQFVVGICVSEFRNGVLLSRVQRDFQFNVTFCEKAVTALVDAEFSGGFFQIIQCENDTSLSLENLTPPDQPVDSFLWKFILSQTDTLFSSEQNLSLSFPGPGLYEGSLIANPGIADCSDTARIQVVIVPEITADFSINYDTCIAGPVAFQDQTDTSGLILKEWSWSFGEPQSISQQRNPIHNYSSPGIFSPMLVVTDTFGCEDQVQKTFTWQPAPPIIVVDPSRFEGCPTLDISFQNLSFPIDETYDIRWTFSDDQSFEDINLERSFSDPGLYSASLSITSPIGCRVDTFYEDWIEVFSPPTADFTLNPPVATNFEPEVQFTDRSSPDATAWRWIFPEDPWVLEQNPRYSFPDTGLQEVLLIVANEPLCYDTLRKLVDVVPEIRFFLPNAFSPNGDALNDVYLPKGYFDGIRDYQFMVWNRWGELVFESNRPQQGWNGQAHNAGRDAPAGIYPYRIQFRGPRGKPYFFEDVLTLIR